MKIAYFINQYPAVSHTFIRREILALERLGMEIIRVSVRGWDLSLLDNQDLLERNKTIYVLKSGLTPLMFTLLKVAFTNPIKFAITLMHTIKLGFRADKPLLIHLIYLFEACQLYLWSNEFKIQHIHAHFGTNPAEVVLLTYLLGGPTYSFTVHGPEEFDKAAFLHLADKILHAKFVVAISSFTRSQLYRWCDYKDWHKIKVIRCGLESNFYELADSAITSSPRFVCVGRLCEQKGQLLLVEAFSKLDAKGIDFELVLAGDGEMRSEIEALIHLHSLETKITITGWITSNQVRAEILASRALVLPSFAEGLPVVIMEAMALGRPVLTTYVAGIPELVQPSVNGWLFPAGDVDELVCVLNDVLATSTATLEQMGKSAHQRVVERHSIDVEAAKLADLFMQVKLA